MADRKIPNRERIVQAVRQSPEVVQCQAELDALRVPRVQASANIVAPEELAWRPRLSTQVREQNECAAIARHSAEFDDARLRQRGYMLVANRAAALDLGHHVERVSGPNSAAVMMVADGRYYVVDLRRRVKDYTRRRRPGLGGVKTQPLGPDPTPPPQILNPHIPPSTTSPHHLQTNPNLPQGGGADALFATGLGRFFSVENDSWSARGRMTRIAPRTVLSAAHVVLTDDDAFFQIPTYYHFHGYASAAPILLTCVSLSYFGDPVLYESRDFAFAVTADTIGPGPWFDLTQYELELDGQDVTVISRGDGMDSVQMDPGVIEFVAINGSGYDAKLNQLEHAEKGWSGSGVCPSEATGNELFGVYWAGEGDIGYAYFFSEPEIADWMHWTDCVYESEFGALPVCG